MPDPAPATIERMPDGRHAVKNAAGMVVGMHNSPFSAARQVHEYYGPTSAGKPGQPGQDAEDGGKVRPTVPRPSVPHPGRNRPGPDAPKIPHGKV